MSGAEHTGGRKRMTVKDLFAFARKKPGASCGCAGGEEDGAEAPPSPSLGRRQALSRIVGGGVAAAGLARAAPGLVTGSKKSERKLLEWEERLKGHFRLMSDEERDETLARLEKLHQLKHGTPSKIKGTPAQKGVLYGYAFNISKCKGYRNCVSACVAENNQDRDTRMQYIRIFEMKNGKMDLEEGTAAYEHPVPAEGHFYLGTQCFQCSNPPCVDVCPVGATWQEPDGITVIDYDWCIGCRYCEAACPYWARRFNWQEPAVPAEEMNNTQHYLGNRMRKKGVMEKCTFCIQRTREGRHPACVEACPTGARIFGNLLDPDSEIRYVLKHKKVFRLKEDLKTDPKFWYFMD